MPRLRLWPQKLQLQASAKARLGRSRHISFPDSRLVRPKAWRVARKRQLSRPQAAATSPSSRRLAREGGSVTGSARPTRRSGSAPPRLTFTAGAFAATASWARSSVHTLGPARPRVSSTAPSGAPTRSWMPRPQLQLARRSPEGQDQTISCCSGAACSDSNSTMAASSSPRAAQHTWRAERRTPTGSEASGSGPVPITVTCPERPPKQPSPTAHQRPQTELLRHPKGRGRGPSCSC
mmetsp:Transcript_47058/g.111781  ORF Transcript_47058/g.111781 Transcript_47058/m.111781 type:complete len:236 (+) Transcript_47058:2-709(+)